MSLTMCTGSYVTLILASLMSACPVATSPVPSLADLNMSDPLTARLPKASATHLNRFVEGKFARVEPVPVEEDLIYADGYGRHVIVRDTVVGFEDDDERIVANIDDRAPSLTGYKLRRAGASEDGIGAYPDVHERDFAGMNWKNPDFGGIEYGVAAGAEDDTVA